MSPGGLACAVLSAAQPAGESVQYRSELAGLQAAGIGGINQNGFKPNFIDRVSDQADPVVKLLAHMKARQLTRIEPTAKGQADWTQTIHQKAKDARDFWSQCTLGYDSGDGDLYKWLLVDGYVGVSLEFSKITAEWRHDGWMKVLVLL